MRFLRLRKVICRFLPASLINSCKRRHTEKEQNRSQEKGSTRTRMIGSMRMLREDTERHTGEERVGGSKDARATCQLPRKNCRVFRTAQQLNVFSVKG